MRQRLSENTKTYAIKMGAEDISKIQALGKLYDRPPSTLAREIIQNFITSHMQKPANQ